MIILTLPFLAMPPGTPSGSSTASFPIPYEEGVIEPEAIQRKGLRVEAQLRTFSPSHYHVLEIQESAHRKASHRLPSYNPAER